MVKSQVREVIYLNIIKGHYEKTYIIINFKKLDYFSLRSIKRQGCPLSPHLFSIVWKSQLKQLGNKKKKHVNRKKKRRKTISIFVVKVTQLCLTLCNPTNYAVHVILQSRILDWVAFPFSRGSSQPRDQTRVSCIAGSFYTS